MPHDPLGGMSHVTYQRNVELWLRTREAIIVFEQYQFYYRSPTHNSGVYIYVLRMTQQMPPRTVATLIANSATTATGLLCININFLL